MSLTDMVIMPGGDYQAACDAIREKTGGTEPIKSGNMAAQIRGIVGQDTTMEDYLVSGETNVLTPIPSVYSNDRITQVRSYAFSSLPHFIHADLPNVVTVKSSAFTNSSFQTITLPNCTTIESGAFQTAQTLARVDIGRSDIDTPNIELGTFTMCMALATLILRGKTVSTLAGTVAFMETPIAKGTGYIYVPNNLLVEYKSATNWSTYANRFRAIEAFPDICG